MAEICRKVLAFQAPPNLKNARDNRNEDNKVIADLREKMRRLKFRLLDFQNQNMLLRKELKVANKVMGNELPSDGVFKGNEDEAFCLRNKITELKKRIEELGGEKATSSTEDLNKEKVVLHGDNKQVEKKKASASLDKLIAGCVGVKAKIDYWITRNKELEEITSVLRLELDRLVEKSNENQEIRKAFPVTERELRARQVEKQDMRRKLDILKSRNEQLQEELTMLKEDTNKMANKTGDDNMLLEALMSQQGSFQDLIERQKMLRDNDYHHFRQDMRKIHSKHTTNLNLVNQLQEDTSEKDEIIRGLQDYMMLSAYAQDEKKEAKTFLITIASLTSSDKSETQEEKSKVVPKANQVKTGEGPPLETDQDREQELLKEEYDKIKMLFESVQNEVEHFAEVALSNNRK
ncbi:uncharacterized protein TNIN_4031 [Trichonephila inaurata madagascariensis]|uniref:Uncharacterized protein n=1 Tax=Trichonephila inaurata madagascariensis TaxID=2747483 RepID=A0A8X6XUH3_9ARAC|nr:uncharacterized protein TNIN_4031 [Trichonephila inaurata madagascariensis]